MWSISFAGTEHAEIDFVDFNQSAARD